MNGGNSHPNMKTRMALLLSHPVGFRLPATHQEALSKRRRKRSQDSTNRQEDGVSVPTRQPICSAGKVKISGIACLHSLAAQKGSNCRNLRRETGGILPKLPGGVK